MTFGPSPDDKFVSAASAGLEDEAVARLAASP
jgi:hypothetical protein